MNLRDCTFVLVLAALFGACLQTAEATTYTADGLACVDAAKSRAEADACRCGVEQRYRQPPKHCAGGGAP